MGALDQGRYDDGLLMRQLIRPAAPPVVIGCDIGQRADPTAVAVAEVMPGAEPGEPPVFVIRHLERLPLGTPYPAVATRLAQIATRVRDVSRPGDPSPPDVTLMVDATGVGRPIVDLLERETRGTGARLLAATFTHGDTLTAGSGRKEYRVGKAFLVSRLQALFQTDRIRLPADHPEARAMLEELLNYEIKVDDNARDTYGAFRVGTHDDLVTALGLAVLRDGRYRRSIGSG